MDDSLWVDLVERGRAPERVIWFYKVDLDPAVKLADGWRSIGYVVLGETGETTDGLPTVQAAVDHSEVVATFGSGPDTSDDQAGDIAVNKDTLLFARRRPRRLVALVTMVAAVLVASTAIAVADPVVANASLETLAPGGFPQCFSAAGWGTTRSPTR